MHSTTRGSQEKHLPKIDGGVPYQFLAFVACLLFIGMLPLPYGYYTFMRIVVCGCAAFLCYSARMTHSHGIWMWLWGAIAVLFNPLAPVHMTKEIWMVADLLAGVLFVYEAIKVFAGSRNHPCKKLA